MSDWHKIGTTGIGGMGTVYVAPVGTELRRRPLEYSASQQIPQDFASQPELVANIITGRVEYLLERILADGLNPVDGTLTVEPFRRGINDGRAVNFTWVAHE